MKFLLLSDTHLRSTAPIGRKDNFRETQNNKWNYVVDTAIKEKVDAVLQAGDLFDIPSPSLGLLTEFITHLKRLQEHNIEFLAIPGQHDMLMRSTDLSRTAMGVLNEAELLIIVGDIISFSNNNRGVNIHGYGFGNSAEPSVNDEQFDRSNDLNIMMIHAMIGNKPLYPGHDITYAKKFLNSHPDFDLILCADYHYPFLETSKGKIIVNTGCLTRLTRHPDDMYRIPHFYIYDTNNKELEKFSIDIPPVEETFSLSDFKEGEIDKKNIVELIERLRNKGTGIGFLSVLENYYDDNEVDEEIRKLIAEELEQ